MARRGKRVSVRDHIPLETNRSVRIELFDLKVDATGSREAIVARLPAEYREPENTEAALDAVGRCRAHLHALEGLHGGRFTGLQPET